MNETIKSIIKKERTWEIIFLGFLFCFYMGWAYLLPFNSCPDEAMRFQVADYIYQHGTLPHGAEESIRNPIWGISYAFYPMLAYMVGAVFMKITSFFTTSFEWLVLAARMVSVLCGMGMAVFTIKTGKRLFKGWQALVFIAIVLLLPQSVYMFTYVNNDSLALFSASVIVYMWIKGLDTKWDLKYCVGLAIGISLCAMSYYNAYGFILCSIILFGLSILFCYEKAWDIKPMFAKGLLVSAIVLALVGWWYVRNYLLYDGDFLGLEITNHYAELYAQEGMKPSQRSTPQTLGLSVWEMLFVPYGTFQESWVYWSATSFIGCFDYMTLLLPNKITYPYLAFLAFGLLSTVVKFRDNYAFLDKRVYTKKVSKSKKVRILQKGIFNWSMLTAMLIPVVLSVYNSYTNDFQAQGRYCLPMLMPLSYFVTTGLGNVLEKIIKNKKVKDAVYAAISLGLLVVVLYIYKAVIRTNYLPAPLIDIGI